MALQVAGVEKINSMDFAGHWFTAWNFVGYRFTVPCFPDHQISNDGVENEWYERSLRIFEIKQRAGSPRSQGFNIFHKATKKYYGCIL